MEELLFEGWKKQCTITLVNGDRYCAIGWLGTKICPELWAKYLLDNTRGEAISAAVSANPTVVAITDEIRKVYCLHHGKRETKEILWWANDTKRLQPEDFLEIERTVRSRQHEIESTNQL